MKILVIITVLTQLILITAMAAQKEVPFENSSNGRSKVERIDSNVGQINSMIARIQALEASVASFKTRIASLEAEDDN
jgi:hypothetical protein